MSLDSAVFSVIGRESLEEESIEAEGISRDVLGKRVYRHADLPACSSCLWSELVHRDYIGSVVPSSITSTAIMKFSLVIAVAYGLAVDAHAIFQVSSRAPMSPSR
jgi:hypothetical protein